MQCYAMLCNVTRSAAESEEKWAVKLQRRKDRAQDLAGQVEHLRVQNEVLAAECKHQQRDQQLSSSAQEESAALKVEAQQARAEARAATVSELREQLQESQQQCREAEATSGQLALKRQADEGQAQATLQLCQAALSRELQQVSALAARLAEVEERAGAELEAERRRSRELEAGRGQASAE